MPNRNKFKIKILKLKKNYFLYLSRRGVRGVVYSKRALHSASW